MTFLSCYWPLFSKRPRALKASIRTCAEEKRSRRRCNIFSRRSPGSRRVTSHVNATLFRLNASGSSCHFSWLDHFYNEIWNGVWLCEANLLLAKWLSKSLKVRLFLMQSGSIREICQLPLSHSSYFRRRNRRYDQKDFACEKQKRFSYMWEFSCEFTSRIKAGSPSTTQRLFPLKPRVLRGRVQYPGLKVAQPEASYTLQGHMQNSAMTSWAVSWSFSVTSTRFTLTACPVRDLAPCNVKIKFKAKVCKCTCRPSTELLAGCRHDHQYSYGHQLKTSLIRLSDIELLHFS